MICGDRWTVGGASLERDNDAMKALARLTCVGKIILYQRLQAQISKCFLGINYTNSLG